MSVVLRRSTWVVGGEHPMVMIQAPPIEQGANLCIKGLTTRVYRYMLMSCVCIVHESEGADVDADVNAAVVAGQVIILSSVEAEI